MTEVEQPPQNGIDLSAAEDDDSSKARPADIEQDMREMERRKRVEAIMSSKLFREELERIVDSARDGATGILQQLSDIVGVPVSRVGSMFKASSCMMPINDIRGVESMGYAKGEKILRCKLAATFRLLDLYGWTQGLGAQITARLKVDQEYFLVNPYGLLYHEITASALNKVDMQGHIVEQGTTNFGVNKSQFVLHSVVHAARPDIRCAIYIGCSPVVAISSIKAGLLPLTKDACVLGEVTTFSYTGSLYDEEERNRLVRNLGPNSKVMLLTNYGALCCGETIEEAFFAACHIVQACETQLKLLPIGLDNLVLIPEESRKVIYEHSRRPPEDLEKKFAATATVSETTKTVDDETAEKEGGGNIVTITKTSVSPKWRVGGAEFEALMRMLDNAGFRTGYIYRHPLVKSEPPKPKSDVELPPAVSSLGYLLEEEELFRQGIWKKGDLRKGGDRSRWLNSPNVYQKVEVLETGTPDPKKITKWVAEGSPTHSTPVRIEDPLQFVPPNTNPKEFKRVQQQIKENRRADKISAGPQSHILEGVTWDEANRIKDATVSSAGDHVVLVGAASKGIIQRGYQHNATVYKAPYAKNPFDNVTDDELNEYKRTVERKKKSIHGEYTDTDFSESEALSSQQTSGAQQHIKETTTTTTTTTAAVSQSEPEDVSEHHVMRIETQQAPIPSQPEVVLSDANQNFINGERSHMAANRKPLIGRDEQILQRFQLYQDSNSNQARYYQQQQADGEQSKSNSSNRIHFQGLSKGKFQIKRNQELIKELKSDSLFQRQKEKHVHPPSCPCSTDCINNGNSYANNLIYSQPYSSNQKSKSNTDCYSPHLYETFSYYGATNNRDFLHDDDYDQSLLYDETNDNLINATVASYDMNAENSYKKSAQCSTPNICGIIFRSMQKPRREFVQQDLIWNIPFSHPFSTSPASMPEINYALRRARVDTPQKSCKLRNKVHKRQSPYRTVSHFGFKSPQKFSKPEHKHVPVPSEPKKYVPLRRSISYEEIFSSPRYLDLCEHCFEQIVRLKPELISYRAKLRNLAECPIASNSPTISNANNAKMVEAGTGANLETLTNTYDLETVVSEISEPIAAFSSGLEPLLEVEERESYEDRTTSAIVNAGISAINSFMEKISSMSFSEAPDANYLSAPPTSKTSLSMLNTNVNAEEASSNERLKESADGTFENEAFASSDKMLDHQREENVGKEDKEEPTNHNRTRFVSITEIWEFGDWMDSKEEHVQNEKCTQNEECTSCERHLQNDKSDLFLEDIDEKDAQGITSTKTQTDEIVTFNRAETVSLSSSTVPEEEQQLENFDSNEKTGYSSSRSLKNRTDQEGRNVEFQELWGEDDITNCENLEQGYSSTFSDDESAIEEGQQQQNFDQDRESFISPISQNLGTEVFHGHSVIIRSSLVRPRQKTDYSDPNEQAANKELHLSQQSSNDDCLSLSQRTFSLSEPSSSNENLLIRSYGCTNLAADFAYRRIERRSCERIVETFIGNKRINSSKFEDLDNLPEAASSTLDLKRSYGGFQIEEKQSSEANTGDEQEYDKAEGESRSNEVEIFEVTDVLSGEGHNVDEEDKYIYELKSVDDRIVVNDDSDDDHDIVIQREWDVQSNVSDNSEDILQNVENLQVEEIDEVFTKNRKEATLESNDLTLVEEEENVRENDNNLPQFSMMEREILKKIEINQLNKSAEIFNKIESSIRNKLTPFKLELLVKQNSLGKSVVENSSTPQVNNNFLTSTPTKFEEHEKQANSTEQNMMAPTRNEPVSEIKIETMHHFQHTLDIFHTSANNYLSNSHTKLTQKYSFLYKTQWSSSMHLMQKSIHLFMIYKIEIYPHYTYPIITKKIMCDESKETFDMTNAENCCAHSSNADLCSSPPYRTLSHYGFNYPITYRPSLTLQPVCLLTPIELQRQKIIAFIKRLNFVDNQAVVLDHKKTGEKIIGKCKPINESFDLETLRKTGSFVSIKEVQLFNKSAEENENLKRSSHFQGSHKGSELNSEHCSSLLSISGTYRTNSQTHSIIEIDQDETENCISTEHYSNENLLCKHYLTKQSRNTTSRKPVKNLKGRKGSESEILGDGYHNHVRKPEAEAEPEMLGDEYHDPHKPEAEQRVKNLHCHYKEDNDNSELTNNKHITLTLNTLKRRAIALNNKNKSCLELNKKTPQRNAEAYTSCVSSNDSSSSAAIEIHINVTVRNSECVKSLRIHEREFKAKLEKVIDDEIHLIVQELENQDHDNDPDKEEDEKSRLYENTLNFPSRRLSAPESISVSDRKANATETDHHMPHICGNSSNSSPLCINTKFDSQANLFSLHSLRYRHTLAELEHELETLLNGIIQNMCECKKKVTQISEDIRTSSLHVGPLMKYDQQKSFDVFK